jgi:predicted cation transporter
MPTGTDDALIDASVRQGELLLYDYYKHMTTLCLATLGGILSISQIDGFEIPKRDLLISLGLISFGGFSAISAMESLIKARLAGKSLPRWTEVSRWAVTGGFGLGIGAFLAPLMDKVGL